MKTESHLESRHSWLAIHQWWTDLYALDPDLYELETTRFRLAGWLVAVWERR
jgi:hypothetical protein